MKGRSAGGNLLAKMLPTFEKCLFKILGIREESLVRLLLLSGSFIIHLCLSMFFFILFKLLFKKGAVIVFLTETCKTANFISIIFILFLIANLVQSVFFFD